MPSQRTLTLIGIFGVLVAMAGLAWDILLPLSDVHRTSAVDKFYRITAIVSCPLDLLLLAASIAALCRGRGAPRLLRGWAIIAIAYAAGRLMWALTIVGPAATTAARAAAIGKPPSEFSSEFAGMVFSIIAVIAFAVTCVLPISMIVTMRSPKAHTPVRGHAPD